MINAAPKLHITFESDPFADYSYLEQWDTPEKYAGSKISKPDGTLASFEEYRAYWGNPARMVALLAQVQSQCECCGSWVNQAALGDIHFMDDDAYYYGTYTEEQTTHLQGYCKDVAADLFAETRHNLAEGAT